MRLCTGIKTHASDFGTRMVTAVLTINTTSTLIESNHLHNPPNFPSRFCTDSDYSFETMSAAEEIKANPHVEPQTTETKETDTTTAPTGAREDSTSKSEQSSYTGMASAATSSATNAAVGVKDSVFSMFGGGAKKDKKEDDEAQDRSGSSKAQKAAEGEDEEVF